MKAMLVIALIAVPSAVVAQGKKTASAKTTALDCKAYKAHLFDVGWEDFLSHEGKDMDGVELGYAKKAFAEELYKQPEVKQAMNDCATGKVLPRIYDCQMKSRSPSAWDACSR